MLEEAPPVDDGESLPDHVEEELPDLEAADTAAHAASLVPQAMAMADESAADAEHLLALPD